MKSAKIRAERQLRYFITLIALVTVGIFSQSVYAISKDRIALVIGNNEYTRNALLNPVNDATAISNIFQDMDYDYVRVEFNTSRLKLEEALDEFSERAENSDIAVIYYAGHGIQVGGENYLIPTDVELKKKRDLNRLVSLKELTAEVGQAARLGLVILDACRDNPFADDFGAVLGRSTSIKRGLRQVSKLGGNTLVAYATEENNIADDGQGEHSPYAAALIRHLGTPRLEVRRMFGKVRDDVLRETNASQRPFVYGSLGGDEIFLRKHSVKTNISRADVDLIGQRFLQLKNAVSNKNLIRIGSLTNDSSDISTYIMNLFREYKEIDVELTDITVQQASNTITSGMQIKQLRRNDNSIESSKELMRYIPMQIERGEDGWSRIQW